MRVAQSRDDLNRHLVEQGDFLKTSADSFDAGHEAEAKRLASILRLLLHDTGRSQALLGQLGVLYSMPFVDSIGAAPEKAVAWIPVQMSLGPRGMVYHAKLGTPTLRSIPFAEWWAATIYISAVPKLELTRKDLVLSMADMDGGAHVDPELKGAYAFLSRQDVWETYRDGVKIDSVTPGPVKVLVRQIAHEVDRSLRDTPVGPKAS